MGMDEIEIGDVQTDGVMTGETVDEILPERSVEIDEEALLNGVDKRKVKTVRKVLNFIQNNSGQHTAKEIARGTGISYQTILSTMEDFLLERGVVEKEGMRPALYSLSSHLQQTPEDMESIHQDVQYLRSRPRYDIGMIERVLEISPLVPERHDIVYKTVLRIGGAGTTRDIWNSLDDSLVESIDLPSVLSGLMKNRLLKLEEAEEGTKESDAVLEAERYSILPPYELLFKYMSEEVWRLRNEAEKTKGELRTLEEEMDSVVSSLSMDISEAEERYFREMKNIDGNALEIYRILLNNFGKTYKPSELADILGIHYNTVKNLVANRLLRHGLVVKEDGRYKAGTSSKMLAEDLIAIIGEYATRAEAGRSDINVDSDTRLCLKNLGLKDDDLDVYEVMLRNMNKSYSSGDLIGDIDFNKGIIDASFKRLRGIGAVKPKGSGYVPVDPLTLVVGHFNETWMSKTSKLGDKLDEAKEELDRVKSEIKGAKTRLEDMEKSERDVASGLSRLRALETKASEYKYVTALEEVNEQNKKKIEDLEEELDKYKTRKQTQPDKAIPSTDVGSLFRREMKRIENCIEILAEDQGPVVSELIKEKKQAMDYEIGEMDIDGEDEFYLPVLRKVDFKERRVSKSWGEWIDSPLYEAYQDIAHSIPQYAQPCMVRLEIIFNITERTIQDIANAGVLEDREMDECYEMFRALLEETAGEVIQNYVGGSSEQYIMSNYLERKSKIMDTLGVPLETV